jgi:pimeloyl-ACP methyl ester carboxylesterase
LSHLIDLLVSPAATSDSAQLAKNGRVVTGIAADGAARVVVRVKTGQPGTVEFSLVDENGLVLPPSNFNGSLSQVSEDLGSGSVSVSTVDVEGFGPMAFAAYHAPMDFSTSPDSKEANDPDRKVSIKVKLTTATGETVESTESIKIVRPPVVPVHGLRSDDRTWDNFAPLITSSVLSVYRINYKDSNAREIGFNATLLLREVKKIVEDHKMADQVAAVQVDLVTHSMGGLLARMLPVFSSSFLREDNFRKGDVHKLINIGTPHRGSELAGKLRTKKNNLLCRAAFNIANSPIDQGAIDDLSPGSEALRVINGFPSSIPVHNNVGIASALQKQINVSGFLLHSVQLVCGEIIPPGGFDELFKGDDSDLLVSATSQRGGHSNGSSAVSNFPPNGPNLIHTTANGIFDVADGEAELESQHVSSRVIQLLNSSTNSPLFVRLMP